MRTRLRNLVLELLIEQAPAPACEAEIRRLRIAHEWLEAGLEVEVRGREVVAAHERSAAARLGAACVKAVLDATPADALRECGTRKRAARLHAHADTELLGLLGAQGVAVAVTPQQPAAKRRRAADGGAGAADGRALRGGAARPCDY